MFLKSLSGRLLLLTIVFVMLAEVLIFVPSVARFRYEYLQERLERAQIASLAVLATPNDMVEEGLEAELLNNAGVLNIVLRRDETRQLILANDMPAPIDKTVDLRNDRAWVLIRDAFDTLFNGPDRVLRIIGNPVKGAGDLIDVSMLERPLHEAMIDYGKNILLLSFVISLITSALLFGAVRRFMVRPISRVVRQIQNFQAAPENRQNIIEPTAGVTELYEAELALQAMETELNQSLRQKERLAALGAAVSKISHDLRNILTTTQLLADRMEHSDDPRVQKTAPKLVNSLSRAVNLCERTLTFGKAEEPAPSVSSFVLRNLVEDVVENERLALAGAPVSIEFDVSDAIQIEADQDQLFRVISNLVRNAREVLSARKEGGTVRVSADETPQEWTINVTDDGPGLPEKALENLFTPFQGGARVGGSGLGLAISAELVKGHNVALELIETGAEGTRFRITLPRNQSL